MEMVFRKFKIKILYLLGLLPLLVGVCSAVSFASDETKDNIEKIKNSIQSTEKKVDELQKNIESSQLSLKNLEQEFAVKNTSYEEIKNNLKRSQSSLDQAAHSEVDFQKSHQRDLEQTEATKKEIESIKKRLVLLQGNLKLLQDNAQVGQDNIEKVSKAREIWEKNTKNYKASLTELERARNELEIQVKAQRENLSINRTEYEKWNRQLSEQKNELSSLKQN